jgi:hypothetical protein
VLGLADRNPTADNIMLIINRYAMKRACPRVGIEKVSSIGELWRRPTKGGSMKTALNHARKVAGNGMKRSREETIGMIAPVRRRTKL